MQLSKIKDTLTGTVIVALILCVVCSFVVAGSAEFLRKKQDENVDLDLQKNILDAAGVAMGEYGRPASELDIETVKKLYSRVTERFVNLDGTYNTEQDSKKYKLADAIVKGPLIENPKFNPGEQRRPAISKVYFIKSRTGDDIENVVLPIYGKGLWGTLWGYLALESDLETIQGINFYSHKETPGLGGEVDNPNWKRQWEGKKLYDPQGEPAALVFKGSAPAGNPYAVDGLSGATITSRGVTNFVRYWASEDGFKPFLEKLKQEMKQPAATSSDKDQNNG